MITTDASAVLALFVVASMWRWTALVRYSTVLPYCTGLTSVADHWRLTDFLGCFMAAKDQRTSVSLCRKFLRDCEQVMLRCAASAVMRLSNKVVVKRTNNQQIARVCRSNCGASVPSKTYGTVSGYSCSADRASGNLGSIQPRDRAVHLPQHYNQCSQ